MIHRAAIEPGLCPDCGAKGKAIIYGLPTREEISDDFHLGGCLIELGHDPKYFCDACNVGFGIQDQPPQ